MQEFSASHRLMGSDFSLGVVCATQAMANDFLQSGYHEIRRIENLLSEFLEDSDTTKLNSHAANSAMEVESETFALLQKCMSISSLTKGDFDITVSPLKKLYRFKNEEFQFPPKELIKETQRSIGYQKIILDLENCTVNFTHPGTQISFAAIGKGYASDMVKKMWQKQGLQSGYINASGDLNVFGQKPSGEPWQVGIANPSHPDVVLFTVPIYNASVATSGDAVQHFFYQGKKYSHNINPHTGMPLNGVSSVTVFSPSAELSDALATAAYVKGVKKGLEFINQLPDTHCIFIDEKKVVHFSHKLKYETNNS